MRWFCVGHLHSQYHHKATLPTDWIHSKQRKPKTKSIITPVIQELLTFTLHCTDFDGFHRLLVVSTSVIIIVITSMHWNSINLAFSAISNPITTKMMVLGTDCHWSMLFVALLSLKYSSLLSLHTSQRSLH